MLGIRKVDTTSLTHREFWIDCLIDSVGLVIDIAERVLGMLSFGYLTANWGTYWFNLTYKEKHK